MKVVRLKPFTQHLTNKWHNTVLAFSAIHTERDYKTQYSAINSNFVVRQVRHFLHTDTRQSLIHSTCVRTCTQAYVISLSRLRPDNLLNKRILLYCTIFLSAILLWHIDRSPCSADFLPLIVNSLLTVSETTDVKHHNTLSNLSSVRLQYITRAQSRMPQVRI